MDQVLEQRIRARAYEIWEQNGRSGDPEDNWLRAERELAEDDHRAPASQAPAQMTGLGAMTASGDYSGWTARNDKG